MGAGVVYSTTFVYAVVFSVSTLINVHERKKPFYINYIASIAHITFIYEALINIHPSGHN